MRAGWLGLVWVATGCDQSLVRTADDFGPFFVLSGRLDSALLEADDPSAFDAGIAWLVVSDDTFGARWQSADIEPRLFGYAMAVGGPPELARIETTEVAPPELRLPDTRVAVGLPVLHVGERPPLDPDALLLWALGTLPDTSRIFGPVETTARAAATRHVIGVLRVPSEAAALADAPGFVDEAPWCRWAQFQPGLALYRDDGTTCDGWRSIAYAEEYQGVDMVQVSPSSETLPK